MNTIDYPTEPSGTADTQHGAKNAHEHWKLLLDALPQSGVNRYFKTEARCVRRLKEVRWPDGIVCEGCGSKNVGKIRTRKTYQCRECRDQFSVTSGTICHRKHLDLMEWFYAAELIISASAKDHTRDILSSEGLKKKLGVTYKVAYDLRKKLKSDLLQPHGGLIGRCICVHKKPD